MSLIRRLSYEPEAPEHKLHHKFSWNDSSHGTSSFSNDLTNISNRTPSGQSIFGLMGYGDVFSEHNDVVKKYSEQEELLNDRFIPMRKASSLKIACEDPEAENNENIGEEDDQALSIPSLYKKHILSISNGQSESGIDAFKNSNGMKYRQTNSMKEPSFVTKNSACLEINDEIS